ncbi:hypothetical protein FA13DRAFT_502907 [Coprinellus micaceus]|uniref:Uncharacterized protein n=1 Tax=Coprinellus micaceus TaxID=71717 RepID=A0A4Y7TAE9_COPMI|nr:hypothetical protein FA13DRAFT_502907 [Coprinellus micaceus]
MKFAPLAVFTLAIAHLVTALPTPPGVNGEPDALEARVNDVQCNFASQPRSTRHGNFCDAQGCEAGGGVCRFRSTSPKKKHCYMTNMRGRGADPRCQYCGCTRA